MYKPSPFCKLQNTAAVYTFWLTKYYHIYNFYTVYCILPTYNFNFSSQESVDSYPLPCPSLSPSLLESVEEKEGAFTEISYPIDDGVIVNGLFSAPQLPAGPDTGNNAS